jgi:hypothetical protein
MLNSKGDYEVLGKVRVRMLRYSIERALHN